LGEPGAGEFHGFTLAGLLFVVGAWRGCYLGRLWG
jgi:hypothetical protein